MVSRCKKGKANMSSQVIRAMTRDGSARVVVCNTSEIVREAQRLHALSPTAEIALGQLLTAASMMGSLMGEKQEKLTLGIQGDGPLGNLLVTADYYGNVRGYVQNPEVDLPQRADRAPDLAGAIGDGLLYVIHDTGAPEKQTGTVRFSGGEIPQHITLYYAESEQIPSACSLGVQRTKDGDAPVAGGVLIQLLPGASEEVIAELEGNIPLISNVSQLLGSGCTCEDLMARALANIPYDLIDAIDVDYLCSCSREGMRQNVLSLGRQEIEKVFREQAEEGHDTIECVCHFCNSTYEFTLNEFIEKLDN